MAEEWSSWVPILRVKDAQVSAKFYREAMGFRVDWEHRFADGFPLYMQISRSPLVLHVSEHQGGGTTAAEFFVRVPMWMPSICLSSLSKSSRSIPSSPTRASWAAIITDACHSNGSRDRQSWAKATGLSWYCSMNFL